LSAKASATADAILPVKISPFAFQNFGFSEFEFFLSRKLENPPSCATLGRFFDITVKKQNRAPASPGLPRFALTVRLLQLFAAICTLLHLIIQK
jgi:hypothetical protein